MANALYAKGAERLLSGSINLVTATVKFALVANTYPQDLVVDEFYTAISAYVRGTPQALASKSVSNGVFDAGDVTFAAVTAGDTLEGGVLFVDTGTAGTSPLLAYIDNITGFPLLTNGGDVIAQWDNGAYKIFSLRG